MHPCAYILCINSLLTASSVMTLCCLVDWLETPNYTKHVSLHGVDCNTLSFNMSTNTHAHTDSSCNGFLRNSHCAFKVFDLFASPSPPSTPAVFSPTARFHRLIAVVCSCNAAVRCSRHSKSSAGTLLTRPRARSANCGELSPPCSAVSSLSKATVWGRGRDTVTRSRRIVKWSFQEPVLCLRGSECKLPANRYPLLVYF